MTNNWHRTAIIQAAAQKIMAAADPAILTLKRGDQSREILSLRHKLQAETGCDFGTTGRHIGLNLIAKILKKEGKV